MLKRKYNRNNERLSFQISNTKTILIDLPNNLWKKLDHFSSEIKLFWTQPNHETEYFASNSAYRRSEKETSKRNWMY